MSSQTNSSSIPVGMNMGSADSVAPVQVVRKFQHAAKTTATRSSLPSMMAGQNNQTIPKVNSTMINDMSSQAKMRAVRSNVVMSAANPESEFTIKTSGNLNMKKNHMDNKFNQIKAACCATAVAMALFSPTPALAADLGNGKNVFEGNCAACHAGGQNVIQAEKTLEKAALEEYLDGGFKESAIVYQVKNGKNSMPAWSGRLTEDEINNVSAYVFDMASNSKWGAD